MPHRASPSDPATPARRRGAVAVIRRREELLVIRRSLHVRAPGAYCFPGGGIEPGERDEEALCRELREELSVRVTPVRRLWQSVTSWNVELGWWLAELELDEPLVPNPAEVASYHWLTPGQIRDLPGLLESNHHFLDAWQRGEFELM
ncbi:MAG: NUDIX domain-containing protein [Pirellulaceae bacterium]|nr:NUDIX domain-containing protein [Pirellulaceae bacterium]